MAGPTVQSTKMCEKAPEDNNPKVDPGSPKADENKDEEVCQRRLRHFRDDLLTSYSLSLIRMKIEEDLMKTPTLRSAMMNLEISSNSQTVNDVKDKEVRQQESSRASDGLLTLCSYLREDRQRLDEHADDTPQDIHRQPNGE